MSDQCEVTARVAASVLIEVPVILLVVKVVNASKGWYEGC